MVQTSYQVMILVIDDDEVLRRRISKRLERHGYQVMGASNGLLGLEQARLRKFDLIMVDHRMPVMGGMEFIRRLVTQEEAPPVIMLTGAGDESVAVEAMKLGASDYVVKDSEGIYLEMFQMVIDQALNRRQLLLDKLRAETALRVSEEQYRLLFIWMQDGFALLGNTGGSGCNVCSLRFQELNPAFGRMFSIVPETLIGQCVCRLRSIPGEDWLPQLDQVRTTGSGRQFEVRSEARNLFFEVTAYIPQPGRIAVIFEDVTARKLYESELERLATTDSLTGVGNRAEFCRRAETELERLRRYQGSCSLLMLDLDDFKKVNDRYGHGVGDQVLIAAVTTIRNCLRKIDVVGRYGGEEFVILLPETDLPEARIVAERIRRTIEIMTVSAGDRTVSITTSCGVTLLGVTEDATITQALDEADQALYRAKHEGRNRTVLFEHPSAMTGTDLTGIYPIARYHDATLLPDA